MTQSDLNTILPLIILASWACVLLLVDLFIPKQRKGITAMLAAFGLALTLGFTLNQMGNSATAFNGMVILDGFAVLVQSLLLVSGLLGVAMAYSYLKRMGIERGEY
jgi:NADH-quinone oxidoreductase subunit N